MPLVRTSLAVAILGAMLIGRPSLGTASRDAAGLCTEAAARASTATGVPIDVLLAISVVETGRDSRPWPWTVNLGGEGHWLASAAAAEALVSKALDQGETNIDLGCFQLNYRWHASAFASVAEMIDPEKNALYAARYLARQHVRTGDWATAAAAYHSATPEHALRYQARFETAWAATARDPGPTHSQAPTAERANGFPLLLAGQNGSQGSLVPQTMRGQRLIGAP